MSLSRSPSPREEGGWSSPGLTENGGRVTPGSRGANGTPVSWEAAKRKSQAVNGGYPVFSTQNNGFFRRHLRSISNSLPRFNVPNGDYSYAEREKLGRGRWQANNGGRIARLRNYINQQSRKVKLRFMIVFAFLFAFFLFYNTRKSRPSAFCTCLSDLVSFTLLLASSVILGRREEISHYTCSKSRRRCHGMERS